MIYTLVNMDRGNLAIVGAIVAVLFWTLCSMIYNIHATTYSAEISKIRAESCYVENRVNSNGPNAADLIYPAVVYCHNKPEGDIK